MTLFGSRRLQVRVSATAVTAELRQAGRRAMETTRRLEPGIAAADALSEQLGRLIRRGAFSLPAVEVALSPDIVRSTVLRFEALPRQHSDRGLIVTQRFCREHKLDAKATAVAFSVHPMPDRGAAVLASAIPHSDRVDLMAPFAAHGLYCDVVAPELSLALSALGTAPATPAAVLAVVSERSCTMLLLGAGRTPLSVVSLTHGGTDGCETEPTVPALPARLKSRVERFAGHLGLPPTDVAVHVYDPLGCGLADALQDLGSQLHRVVGHTVARLAA